MEINGDQNTRDLGCSLSSKRYRLGGWEHVADLRVGILEQRRAVAVRNQEGLPSQASVSAGGFTHTTRGTPEA